MQYSMMMTIRPTNLFPGVGGHLYLKLDIILIKKKSRNVRNVRQCTRVHRLGVQYIYIRYLLINSGKDLTHKLRKTRAKTRI